MTDRLGARLSAHLQVPLSPAIVSETRRMGLASGEGKRLNTRFRLLVSLTIAGGLLVGGGAVAYAAPQTWTWLFPAAVSKTFAFPGGVECHADITASANYGNGKPTPTEMIAIVNAAENIRFDNAAMLGYLASAERDTRDLPDTARNIAERQALMMAVQDQMLVLADARSAATWSVSTSCD